MKNLLIIIIIIFGSQIVFSQDVTVITLEQCRNNAIKNYPSANNKALIDMSSRLKIQNIQTRYLPELNLSARASYQSDVPGFELFIPNIPSLNIPKATKDQYGISLDINQLIYDGGRGKKQKELEEANADVNNQMLEVELYLMKSRINEVYFTVLAVQKNTRLLESTKEELQARLLIVNSAVNNGVKLKSNKYMLQAELLSIEQKLIELVSAKTAAIEVLEELTGNSIGPETQFELPDVDLKNNGMYYRPEYILFDLQKIQIEAGKSFVKTQRMPVVGGFGRFGYGNPGLNMLKDEFDTYFIVGAKMSWNIYDWKNNIRERKTYDLKKEMLDNHQKTFSLNQQSKLKSELAAVRKFEKMLELDDIIIQQRNSIKNSAASQLDQGIITSTDFISYLNAETQARINKEYHKIQLIQARINFNTIYGD